MAGVEKPHSEPEYGEKKYWEDRYGTSEETETYDWYQEYGNSPELAAWVDKGIASKESKILIIGCGNSTMGEQMYKAGYTDITSIDFAKQAIDIMKDRAQQQNLDKLVYLEMDARQMTFSASSFDVVIDKGTLDAMMCGKNNILNCEKTCSEISRILKPGGVFMLITYGKPDTRLSVVDQPQFQWKTEHGIVQRHKDSFHYVYRMTKN
eukprot:TRINITY_DN916_c0_g1_i1.p1 TRINITY_DN916_c0_g1~~TRINITY_DN916_c0_g1_i1.p1  ORF type:complete len:208 (-),score=39.41 TRINITY_DN916_c0_g1_i1:56-679(-)